MRVCALTKNHYEELALFLERQTRGIIPRDVWMDRFGCLWDHNPFFRDQRDQRGWLIMDDQGQIGGMFGSVPMSYYYKGEEKVFAAASSWYVEPSCRKHSLSIFRCFLKQGSEAQLCTTPSPLVSFIFKKNGFKSFEAPWLNEGYFFPINVWEFSIFLRNKFLNYRILTNDHHRQSHFSPALRNFIF